MRPDEHVAQWSALHGDLEPSPLVRRWLGLVLRVARPVAGTGVHPDVLTLLGPALALPALGARGWSAATLVLLSGLLDGIDGSVAVLQGRATRWGYVLDSLADRVADGLVLLVLVTHGADPRLAVACGAAVALLEYARARAGNAGGDEVGAITVGERPVRVLLPAAGLLLGLAQPALVVLTALTAVALVQLLVAVRHDLRQH